MLTKGANIEKLSDEAKNIDIKVVMDLLKIELKIENNETMFYMDGVKLEEEKLQSKESSLAVSIVGGKANNKKLFEFAKELIDNLKINYNVVISGRSIMQIYPETDYHFLVTASLEERIKRKCIQYNGKITQEEVKQNIVKRDELQEKAGFYKKYPNTITVDVTECKSAEESTNKILKYIKLPSAV